MADFCLAGLKEQSNTTTRCQKLSCGRAARHHLPLLQSSVPAPPHSALQSAPSQPTTQSHGSRGSLVCGSLWASIYRKTHKCRSHFLSLLLGFLLSQNRPMTPARDPVSSLAKTSLHSQLPHTHSPPGPQRAHLCPIQDGGASEVHIGRKGIIIFRTWLHCLFQKGKEAKGELTGSGWKWCH